ncbi:hypothetical protein JXB37_06230, partial [candidate division WOR-3 bacterium]|nr:hypothetical protein [candidate division WOR-3 bacterium]
MKRNVVLFAVCIFVPGFISCARNQAPDRPAVPAGVSAGLKDSTYTYSTTVVDPDGDDVMLQLAWGDGDSSGWLGPVASGDTVVSAHAWTAVGVHMVRALARDARGAESEWSGARGVLITATPGNWPPGTPGVLPEFGTGYVGARLEVRVSA